MEAGLAVGEVGASEQQIPRDRRSDPAITQISRPKGVTGGPYFTGRGSILIEGVTQFGAGAPGITLPIETEPGPRGRGAGQVGAIGYILSSDQISADRKVKVAAVTLVQMERALDLDTVKLGISLHEFVNRELVDFRVVGLFENEAIETISEYGGFAGNESELTAEGQVNPTRYFVGKIRVTDLVGVGADMGAIGKTFLSVGQPFSVRKGGSETPAIRELVNPAE